MDSGDPRRRLAGEAHGRYAAYANARLSRSGHFWQNRFFSCSLDRAHLWAALRYVERNPLRAGLVSAAYQWSSAAAHTAAGVAGAGADAVVIHAARVGCIPGIGYHERRNTYTGRPAGSPQFVAWAAVLRRTLAAQPGGRPKKAAAAASAESQKGLFDD